MGGLGPILRYCASPISGAFPQSLTVGHMGANAAFYGVGGDRCHQAHRRVTRGLTTRNGRLGTALSMGVGGFQCQPL